MQKPTTQDKLNTLKHLYLFRMGGEKWELLSRWQNADIFRDGLQLQILYPKSLLSSEELHSIKKVMTEYFNSPGFDSNLAKLTQDLINELSPHDIKAMLDKALLRQNKFQVHIIPIEKIFWRNFIRINIVPVHNMNPQPSSDQENLNRNNFENVKTNYFTEEKSFSLTPNQVKILQVLNKRGNVKYKENEITISFNINTDYREIKDILKFLGYPNKQPSLKTNNHITFSFKTNVNEVEDKLEKIIGKPLHKEPDSKCDFSFMSNDDQKFRKSTDSYSPEHKRKKPDSPSKFHTAFTTFR